MLGGRALGGSIAVHVVGLAVVVYVMGGSSPTPRAVVVTLPAAPPRQPTRDEPIVVEVLDEPAATHLLNERSFNKSAPAATATIPTTSSSSTTASTDASTAPRPAEPIVAHGALAMRGVDLHASADALERIAGTGELPSPVAKTGWLHDISGGGGAARINDAVATIDVERDGTAHMTSKPDIDIHLMIPVLPDFRKDLHDIGESIATWAADPYAGERYGRTMDLAPHLSAIPGQCDTYGDSMCDDAESPEMKVIKNPLAGENGGQGTAIAGGRLDLTSWIGHRHHIDVYASRKLKLLDDTRDERAARGAAFRAEQLAHSAVLMRQNLDGLAAGIASAGGLAKLDATQLADVHAALFELWDECTDDDAGQRARMQVIGWIAAHLPAGALGAFRPDELAAFDAKRTSTEHFAPYQ